MSNHTNQPTAPKQPKLVRVEIALPWAIITALAIALGGITAGWLLKVNDEARISTQASQMAELKAKK